MMGTHGLSGLQKLLLGSVMEKSCVRRVFAEFQVTTILNQATSIQSQAANPSLLTLAAFLYVTEAAGYPLAPLCIGSSSRVLDGPR